MNKNESRYFNTALKMNDALAILLEHKDFDHITVKDICKEAHVNRSTFYLHYSNTYDLLQELIEGLTMSFNEHLGEKENEKLLVESKDLDDLYLITDEFLIPYLSFIKENKNVYKAIKRNSAIFNADKTYLNMFDSVFSPIMTRFGLDKKWHKYVMGFYMNGITSILLDWIADDCVPQAEEISELIKGLVVKYGKKDNRRSKE